MALTHLSSALRSLTCSRLRGWPCACAHSACGHRNGSGSVRSKMSLEMGGGGACGRRQRRTPLGSALLCVQGAHGRMHARCACPPPPGQRLCTCRHPLRMSYHAVQMTAAGRQRPSHFTVTKRVTSLCLPPPLLCSNAACGWGAVAQQLACLASFSRSSTHSEPSSCSVSLSLTSKKICRCA